MARGCGPPSLLLAMFEIIAQICSQARRARGLHNLGGPHFAGHDMYGVGGTRERSGRARKNQYLAALRERFVLLRQRPELGHARRDVGAGYRSVPIGRHLIFYRIEGDDLVILRVLHQRMDVIPHLTPGGT
ncbi:MAG TPA: type II toxin-antitoxin system RelE/ParE family toxin [Rhizomicrobium sp.]